MTRILSLPVVSVEPTSELTESLSREFVLEKPFEGDCHCLKCQPPGAKKSTPFRLLPDQVSGLKAFRDTGCRGGFFNIPVGGGKTALSILLASIWQAEHPSARTMLIIPSSVFRQFYQRDLPWARKHITVNCAWWPLGRASAKKRSTLAQSQRPGCYILPFSNLSTLDTQFLLDTIRPEFIVVDEAHNLQQRGGSPSARSKRFWSHVRKTTPHGVVMSGTMTKRDIMEYHPLIKWSLQHGCPVPRKLGEALEWAEVLGSGAAPSEHKVVSVMGDLVTWADEEPTLAGARGAYRKRLHSTPGFVPPTDKELGIGMLIQAWEGNLRAPNEELAGYLADLTGEGWTHPDGEILKYGLEKHAVLNELSAGFFFRRFWPPDHPLTPKAIERWERGQEYARGLCDFFKSQRDPHPGLDTPLGVGNYHARKGPLPAPWAFLFDLWEAYHELDDPALPERISEAVRVDSFKIDAAVEWAKKIAKGPVSRPRGGILWCHHHAVADWLIEELNRHGLPFLKKGRGDDWEENDGSEQRFCVASIDAHHVGKNLQHHQNQIVVQFPRMAHRVEQLMGRTHRPRQQAEELIYHTLIVTEFEHQQLSATLADAAYDTETLGGMRKMLKASWDPPPREYTEDFLRARGFRLAQGEGIVEETGEGEF
jgi:hypothetical protein